MRPGAACRALPWRTSAGIAVRVSVLSLAAAIGLGLSRLARWLRGRWRFSLLQQGQHLVVLPLYLEHARHNLVARSMLHDAPSNTGEPRALILGQPRNRNRYGNESERKQWLLHRASPSPAQALQGD